MRPLPPGSAAVALGSLSSGSSADVASSSTDTAKPRSRSEGLAVDTAASAMPLAAHGRHELRARRADRRPAEGALERLVELGPGRVRVQLPSRGGGSGEVLGREVA